MSIGKGSVGRRRVSFVASSPRILWSKFHHDSIPEDRMLHQKKFRSTCLLDVLLCVESNVAGNWSFFKINHKFLDGTETGVKIQAWPGEKNTKTWKKQQGVSTTQSWPHVLPFMSPKLLVFDQPHSHQTYLDEFSGLQSCCRMQRVSGRRLVADLGIQHAAQISLRTCPGVVQVWSGSHRIHNYNPPSKYPKLKSDGKRPRDPSNGGGMILGCTWYTRMIHTAIQLLIFSSWMFQEGLQLQNFAGVFLVAPKNLQFHGVFFFGFRFSE